MESGDRKAELIRRAREKAFTLYEGKATPHRSCGIALAETFNLPTRPYQALRRGGLTGEGQCGAIKAGELILGEFFGDPDPTGKVTDRLRQAIVHYQKIVLERVDKGRAATIICNDLTGQFREFNSPERLGFCTNIAATVAECVAEAVLAVDGEFEIIPVR